MILLRGCNGRLSLDFAIEQPYVLFLAVRAGNRRQVMWAVPEAAWGDYADQATVMPLNLEAEVARWGTGTPA